MTKSGRHETGTHGGFSAASIAAALPAFSAQTSGLWQTVLVCAGYFLLALLLARGALAGILAPLGVSFTAAVCCRRPYRRAFAIAALTGSLAGYILSAGAIDGLRYCAASALCFTVGLVLRDLPVLRRSWFAPLTAGTSLMLTGTVYLLSYTVPTREVVLYICEVALAAGAAYCYRPIPALVEGAREAKSERPPNFAAQPDRTARIACLIAAGMSMVLVLCAFSLPAGINPGRLAALYLCLCVAAYDPIYGCAAGLLIGVSVGISLQLGVEIAVIYAASALISGLFMRFGLLWLILAFTLTHAALLPWLYPTIDAAVLYECFISGVIFYITGAGARRYTEKMLRICEKTEKTDQKQSYSASIRARLIGAAQAFSLAGADAAPTVQPLPDAGDVYRLAIDRVCRTCPEAETCHKLSAELTNAALAQAKPTILARSRASPEDFPPYFSVRCQRLPEFIGAVNEFLALRESRTRYARRARDDAALLGAQYGAIGKMLAELSTDLAPEKDPCEAENTALRRALAQNDIALTAAVQRVGSRYTVEIRSSAQLSPALRRTLEQITGKTLGRRMRFTSDEDGALLRLRETMAYAASVAATARAKSGEEISGDNYAYFKTADGIIYLVLADGMGSGKSAARDSETFIAMLAEFLRCGVHPETALRLIHPAYTVRCGGDSFTTCDILRIDLYTGLAESYKCGAAPTYICPVGALPRKLSSASMPVGLPGAEVSADRKQFVLRSGDVAVMLSDGLADEDERWMIELLQENRGLEPAELAELILAAAEAQLGSADDMTVLAVRIGELA